MIQQGEGEIQHRDNLHYSEEKSAGYAKRESCRFPLANRRKPLKKLFAQRDWTISKSSFHDEPPSLSDSSERHLLMLQTLLLLVGWAQLQEAGSLHTSGTFPLSTFEAPTSDHLRHWCNEETIVTSKADFSLPRLRAHPRMEMSPGREASSKRFRSSFVGHSRAV